jgi:hypothetical protein
VCVCVCVCVCMCVCVCVYVCVYVCVHVSEIMSENPSLRFSLTVPMHVLSSQPHSHTLIAFSHTLSHSLTRTPSHTFLSINLSHPKHPQPLCLSILLFPPLVISFSCNFTYTTRTITTHSHTEPTQPTPTPAVHVAAQALLQTFAPHAPARDVS